VYEDVIPDSLCNKIIDEYKNSENWILAEVGNDTINLNARNVNVISISQDSIISMNFKERKFIDDALFKVANQVINKYNNIFPLCNIEQDSGYELLKYEQGQYYIQHTDSYLKHPRAISCSFALNDDYEGGEFAFFDRELKYNLKKGSVIMFPSNFMYPHEIMPIIKGTRYSIITWFV
jgi:predicted 2-oxoglutarate/Fe(II)-dependent dioxygenase YbiX